MLPVTYVVIAITSNISGERKFGHSSIWLGYGTAQWMNHGRPTCTMTIIAATISENNVIASALRYIALRHSLFVMCSTQESNVPE